MIILRQKEYSVGKTIAGSAILGTGGFLAGGKIGKKIGYRKAEKSYDPDKYISELEEDIRKDEETLKNLEKNPGETKKLLENDYKADMDPEEYKRSIEYKKKQIEKIKKNPESGKKDYIASHYNPKYETRGKIIGGSIGGIAGGIGGHKIK